MGWSISSVLRERRAFTTRVIFVFVRLSFYHSLSCHRDDLGARPPRSGTMFQGQREAGHQLPHARLGRWCRRLRDDIVACLLPLFPGPHTTERFETEQLPVVAETGLVMSRITLRQLLWQIRMWPSPRNNFHVWYTSLTVQVHRMQISACEPLRPT